MHFNYDRKKTKSRENSLNSSDAISDAIECLAKSVTKLIDITVGSPTEQYLESDDNSKQSLQNRP